jgi:uracil-DNA glycosylase
MTKITETIGCIDFPCVDTDRNSYVIPPVDIDSAKIKVLMISEAPPNDLNDHYYAAGNPFYLQTVLQAFRDTGEEVTSIKDILDLGVYITTAIKCGKTGYSISPGTIKNCARLLEKEIGLFPQIKAILLGGDVAVKMLNIIHRKQTGQKVIPPGSTYKIRHQAYYMDDIRIIPSYTPAGKNFLIEKSKRKMVAEDIRTALTLTR